MGETYYDVLGISPTATAEEIDVAYRRRAKETHPDLSDDPDAASQFRVVVRAEEVLGDDVERARYDRLGHEAYLRYSDGLPGGSSGVRDADEPSDSRSPDNRGDRRRSGGAATAETSTRGGDWTSQSSDAGARTASADGFQSGAASPGASNRTGKQHASWWERREAEGWRRDEATDDDSAGFTYRVHDFDPDIDTSQWRPTLTQRERVAVACLTVLYPALVLASVAAQFPLVVNVTVALCTFAIVAVLLTRPRVAAAVFGLWSGVAVVAIVASALDPTSYHGLLALVTTWGPFLYALALDKLLG